jgi:signal peptidase II
MKKISHVIILVSIILLDQITKYLARNNIDHFNPLGVLPFLQLVNIRNEGVTFGLFSGIDRIILIIISLATISFFIYLYIKGWMNSISFYLILSGAVGNLTDRVLFGGVTDFIDIFIGQLHWPAFNFADTAIIAGLILILIDWLKQSRLSSNE